MLETDPPEHDRARAVLNRVLSPAAMKRLREGFAAAAERKVDELLERGSFDAIPDLAEAYPAVGLPRRARHAAGGTRARAALRRRGVQLLRPGQRAPPRGAGERRAAHRLGDGVRASASKLAPGGFGAGIHAASDTGEITPEEAPLLVRSLFSAGVDTTVNGIGAAVYCLARFPDQWRKLHANPSLARAAFEEAVRFESPVQTFFRTTTRPVEIGGVEIGEGGKVLMFLGAANRDPRRWERPDEYDIARRASGHVGFGNGVHMCVGQLLARLEGEVLLGAMARKVGSIEIAGPVERRYNNTLRGLASLPVAVTPASA